MVSKVYTVYDCKSEIYLTPFQRSTRGQCIRDFTDTVCDPKSQFNKHPEDYTLFEIGTYDDLSGVFEMYEAKVSIGCAREFLRSEVQ